MNTIPTEQNTERQIQRLAAQRHLYSTAKTIFGWQLFLSGPVTVTLTGLVAVLPESRGYVALWGLLLSLSDIVWLTPWHKRLRAAGARIQELFDCEVLGLPWNDLKAGTRPDPELVKEQGDKYQQMAASLPPLTNWYGRDVGLLPLHVARIVCQRSNCWWDSALHRRYAVWTIGVVIVVFVIMLCLAMGAGATIESFVLRVAAPLSPMLLLGTRQFVENMEAARRLGRLKEHAERLLTDAISDGAGCDVSARVRALQDEILENRTRSPLVFDAVFKRLRNSYEHQMNHGVAELVREVQQKMNPSLPK